MKIVIPGGSGQVGTILARALHGDGHDVVILSRRPAPCLWRVAEGDGVRPGPWVAELDACDVFMGVIRSGGLINYAA